MYMNKWATFAAALCIQVSSGLFYTFGVFALALKKAFNLDQSQIATVGSAFNLGGYCALIAGFVYKRLENNHKLGPRLVLWIGCAANFLGYGVLYLGTQNTITLTYVQVVCFSFLAGSGNNWWDTADLVTNIRNFPNEKGTIVGVMKAASGLSASAYTTIFWAFFTPKKAADYLAFLAVVPSTLVGCLAMWVNHVPYVQRSEVRHFEGSFTHTKRFVLAYVLMGGLALYLLLGSTLLQHYVVTKSARVAMVCVMVGLLSFLSIIPAGSGGCASLPADAEEVSNKPVCILAGNSHRKRNHRQGFVAVARLPPIPPTPTSVSEPALAPAIAPTPVSVPAVLLAAVQGKQPCSPRTHTDSLQEQLNAVGDIQVAKKAGDAASPLTAPESQVAADITQGVLPARLVSPSKAVLGTSQSHRQDVPFVSGDEAAGTHGQLGSSTTEQTFPATEELSVRSSPEQTNSTLQAQHVNPAGSLSVCPSVPQRTSHIPALHDVARPVLSPRSCFDAFKQYDTYAQDQILTESVQPSAAQAQPTTNPWTVISNSRTADTSRKFKDDVVGKQGSLSSGQISSTGRAPSLPVWKLLEQEDPKSGFWLASGHSATLVTEEPRAGEGFGKLGCGVLPEREARSQLHVPLLLGDRTASTASEVVQAVYAEHAVPDLTLPQMLTHLNFYLLFFIFLIGTGSALVFINNISQLLVSLGIKPSCVSSYLSVFSVASAAGRMSFGFFTERALHARGIPRTMFLLSSALLSLVQNTLCWRLRDGGPLYGAAAMGGLAFGSFWVLVPTIASELFGLEHFATAWTYVLQMAPVVGGYLLATFVAGSMYNNALRRQGHTHTCRGPECFQPTFALLVVLSALNMLLALYLWLRTRAVYARIVAHLHAVDRLVEEEEEWMEPENALLQEPARGR